MKKIIKFSIIALTAINLNADEGNGLNPNQMNEIRAIIKQTQQLVNEQQNESMGENIFNEKGKDINKQIQSNFKIDPFGTDNKENRLTRMNIPENEIINFNETSQTTEISKEELELMRRAVRNQNLHALQDKFFSNQYSGYENTKTIKYKPNKTHKIRTRNAMATIFIFDTEIDNYILGDQTGFKAEQIPNQPNKLAIIPQLIGIDTSLTIFTNDGKLHTFYLFSTDYKNKNNPSFIIHIKDEEAQKARQRQKELEKEYLFIKDGIAEVRVKKSDIYKEYSQQAKKGNEWLISAEIFDDKKFTYFKYKKDEMPQIPTIFAVIDKQDSPVETRVIGDYIIAETTNPKWSIKSGNTYVCVERIKSKDEIKRQEVRSKLNNIKEIKQENKALKQLRGF